MELSTYAKKFTLQPKVNEVQVLAGEIYEYFSKQLPFPRIAHEIKVKGIEYVRNNFEQVKKAEVDNRLSLFIWRLKEVKIEWEK